jgi:peptide/nickel transport system substrate-binding protein
MNETIERRTNLKFPGKNWTAQVTLILITASAALAACTPATPAAVENQTAPAPTSTARPTQAPLKTLVVCLGEEPNSLYLYNNPSVSAWSVLEAIYDGPIDTVNYQPQPVILEDLPTQENGGVVLTSVEVSPGDVVANTAGDLVALDKGVKVFPEGCTSNACAVESDGASSLKITQMSATFKIKSGVTWSDGSPLTADDSVYSFRLASDPSTSSLRNLASKTASYTSLDAQTVKWIGKPGYLTQNPSAFFFTPLPQHTLNALSPRDLLTSTLANKSPLGWGPYTLDEWVSGDHIRLVRNEHYFKGSTTTPYYDVLVYRFIGTGSSKGLAGLTSGECDVLDTTVAVEDNLQTVLDLQKSGQARVYLGQGPEWEALDLGIKPASYDDGYNPWLDRQDFFGDIRTRQALTACINREKLISDLFAGQTSVPASYLPPSHPFLDKALTALPYDPQKGSALLEEVGWKDADGDPGTPRVAQGVAGVLDGTELTLSYAGADSDLHRKVAQSIKSDLQGCGVSVNVNLSSVEQAYAAAPDGAIFGRNFDLAEIAWTIGRFPPCYLFSSSEIPSARNSWLGSKYGGVNFTGYSASQYDQACSAMLNAGLSQEDFGSANRTTQEILSSDLPVIPLFYPPHALVTRPDICGVELDVSSRSALRTIESWRSGSQCQ